MKFIRPFSGLPRAGVLFALLAAGVITSSSQTLSTELQKTTVTSDRLEAHNTGLDGQYVFIGHVHITGTNLEILCDRLEIFTVSEEAGSKGATMAESGSIRRVLATGHVSISQEGRKATCGTVEILPAEDRIILTESPVVSDTTMGVTMKGTRMTYRRGERDIEVENPEVVGPALPNLGFPAQSDAAAPGPGSPPPPTAAPKTAP